MLMDAPIAVLLLVMAVMPAVGEEILFRGFVLGSFRKKWGIKWALLVSALVFGAFHTSLVKLIPTALLGASLAYMVVRTGSIYVSMAFHFINNGVSLLVMKYPEQVGRMLPFLLEEDFTVVQMLLFLTVGLICAGTGLVLMKSRDK